MFTIAELKELIEALDQSTLTELALEQDNQKLKLKKEVHTSVADQSVSPQPLVTTVREEAKAMPTENPLVEQAPAEAETKTYDYTIKSPMVGTFYLTSSPDSAPFVAVGDTVKDHTTVCIIEAMKLFNEIEAEVEGELVEILAKNGELVEYNQPLFGIKTK